MVQMDHHLELLKGAALLGQHLDIVGKQLQPGIPPAGLGVVHRLAAVIILIGDGQNNGQGIQSVGRPVFLRRRKHRLGWW